MMGPLRGWWGGGWGVEFCGVGDWGIGCWWGGVGGMVKDGAVGLRAVGQGGR